MDENRGTSGRSANPDKAIFMAGFPRSENRFSDKNPAKSKTLSGHSWACRRMPLALAGRLLLVAASSSAAFELRHDLIEGDAARLQCDQKMIKHVGRLGAHRPFVLGRRGDGELDRLLAELARAMGRPLIEQALRVGLRRAAARASGDGFGEIVEREHSNGSPIPLSRWGVERTTADDGFKWRTRRPLSIRDSRRCRTRRIPGRCPTA